MTATTWQRQVIKEEEVTRYLSNGHDFIDDDLIENQLAAAQDPDPIQIRDILAKSRDIQTLEPMETAALLAVEDRDLL